jgi:hypothetical protein
MTEPSREVLTMNATDDPVTLLRAWADAYRDTPEHRFPSDPDAEFFPVDLEAAANEIERLRAAQPAGNDTALQKAEQLLNRPHGPAGNDRGVIAAQKAVMKYPYFTEPEALQIAKAVVAALPQAREAGEPEDDCSCGGGDVSGHDNLCPYASPPPIPDAPQQFKAGLQAAWDAVKRSSERGPVDGVLALAVIAREISRAPSIPDAPVGGMRRPPNSDGPENRDIVEKLRALKPQDGGK